MSNCPYLNFADHNPDNCEHCSPSGGSNEQAGAKQDSLGRGVKEAVANGDFASAYGLQIDHEMEQSQGITDLERWENEAQAYDGIGAPPKESRRPTSATGETPRTDAQRKKYQAGNDWAEYCHTLDFARQLERELADTNRQREEQQYLAITRGEALDRLRSTVATGEEYSFDWWRAQGLDACIERMKAMRREIDGLRSATAGGKSDG